MERAAWQKLHDEVNVPLALINFIKLHNIGVRDIPQNINFSKRRVQNPLVTVELCLVNNLDRVVASSAIALTYMHGAKSALSCHRTDMIVASDVK